MKNIIILIKSLLSLLFILTIFNLSSCTQSESLITSSDPKIIPASLRAKAWESNKKNLNNIMLSSKWSNLSRVGVTTKDNSASAKLNWVNTANNNYIITLNNFITFGEIIINKSHKTIKIQYQDKQYISDKPEELLYELTQLRVPVSELQYWILGLPSPKYPTINYRLNQYATLEALKQGSFTIEYNDYQIYNKNTAYILPMKIIIKSPHLHLKIQVESWSF